MKKPVWILVANASNAKILEKSADKASVPSEVMSLDHPESRMHGCELSSHPPGHSPVGRTVLASRSDPVDREHAKFAKQVANVLEQAALENRFGSLALFAPSHFLGLVRDRLSVKLQKSIVDSHAVDITSLDTATLNHKIISLLRH
jgi:protein required for attachment to host cells